MISIAPIRLHYFDKPADVENPVKEFVLALVIDKDQFLHKITDKSEFILNLIIWVAIFLFVFFILLIISLYMFVRIANRSLKPIQNLNYKVSTLIKSNGELNLEITTETMTSHEALQMYGMFSELMTAKRFTLNNFLCHDNAVAIMEYAEAHTVFKDNKKAQGI